MEFLVIVLVWLLYSVFDMRLPANVDRWFITWGQQVQQLIGDNNLGIAVRLLLPVILLSVALYLTRHWVFGGVELIIGLLIFSYGIGRTDVERAVKEHQVRMQEGDIQAAYRTALGNFYIDNMEDSSDRLELHQSVRRAVVLDSFDLWFAPMFWMLVAGPAGVLFYRLCSLDYQKDKHIEVKSILHVMNFIPGRLLVLTFAFMGHFVAASKRFLESLVEFSLSTVSLLDEAVLSATGRAPKGLDADPEVSDDIFSAAASNEIELVSSLMSRCVIAWLLVLALVTVFSG